MTGRGADPVLERRIGADVKALVHGVVGLAGHIGERAASEALEAQARGADTRATIVVAGEAKQGKSSLINALLATTDLSPVDADVATSAPIRFVHGEELQATVTLSNGDEVRVEPSDLSAWVSMAAAPLDQLRRVVHAEVALPSTLLRSGVALVDTPGVGGLVSGHARMTMRALERATALLFVTDADTKLTRPELEFLAQAGQRVAAVVFVVTKIDATPDWRAVVAEDRAVLVDWAPRLADAPMLGVSARLATRSRAAAQADRPLAADLWVESGLGGLRAMIEKQLQPVATTLAAANTVATARSTLDHLRVSTERRLLATAADPAVTEAFEAEKARVAQLRSDQQSWSMVLERSLFEARNALRDQVKSSSEALRASSQDLVRTGSSRRNDVVVARVDAELDSQAQEVSIELEKRCSVVCADLLGRIDIGSPLELVLAAGGTVDVKPFTITTDRASTLLSGGMAGATGWSLVSRLVSQSATGGALGALAGTGLTTFALPLVGALVAGYAIHHVRSGTSGRAELAQWVRTEVDRAAGERLGDIERVLTAAKFDIAEVVRAGLTEREREVSAALEEARAARSRSENERAEAEREARRVLNTVTKLSGSADELLEALLTAALHTAPTGAEFCPGAADST